MTAEPSRAIVPASERWRAVPGYPRYEVSDAGRVRNAKTLQVLKLHGDRRGYLRASLLNGKKCDTVRVAGKVLEAFTGKRPPGLLALHNNGINTDNRWTNLRWGTARENTWDSILHQTIAAGQKNGMSKLTAEQVGRIRKTAEAYSAALRDLAEEFHVDRTTVLGIASNNAWRRAGS